MAIINQPKKLDIKYFNKITDMFIFKKYGKVDRITKIFLKHIYNRNLVEWIKKDASKQASENKRTNGNI